MAISVTEPIGWALTCTGRMLFKPFDWRKWFVLGFCAWLAQLGEGGGPNFNAGGGGPGGRSGGGPGPFDPLLDWGREHVGLVILVAVVALVALLAIGLVLTWLSSRGKFMFLDGVVRNRGAVVEPWHRFRTPGNSLFGFRVVFGLAALAVVLLVGGAGLAIAWPDIQAERFGVMAVAGIAVGVLLFFSFVVIVAVIGALLGDFVVPVMYLRGVRTLAAWGIFRREILPGNFWKIVLFYLMRIVLGLGIAVVAIVATCFTCCLTIIPYLGTVILLPIFVFMRSYSVYFLQQFGPGWQFFPAMGGPSPAGVSEAGGSGASERPGGT
ncbi:MAG TPA: hypothetical protein VMW52_08245 [Phycisphaerae bacterium]|nr:hypothetical protein [Phycisphaerae bacterium]